MVKSPIKIIDSGTAPTTENLGEGQIAFGTVDGATKLYGSDGTTISELGGGGGSEVNIIAPLTVATAPTATESRSLAIGSGATTGSSRMSVAIGTVASANVNNAVAVGRGATASVDSIATGYGSQATGDRSTAVGSSTLASMNSATAVGYQSWATGASTTAIGSQAKATGASSVAVGYLSNATEDNTFAVGASTASTRRIVNVTDPTNDQDAATKKYVDTKVSEIPAGPQGDPGEPGPQGDPGAPGTAATITVGTTTTGEAGTEASVTNSGTTSAAVLNFTIPKGAKGDKGDKGDTGNTGPAGTTTFAGLTDQPTDNAALKTALDAKANQTTVDSLTATVNGKVSSVTAGKGVSITGTATAPVVNGMVAVPDYDNAQEGISTNPQSPFTAPSAGVIYNAMMLHVPSNTRATLKIKTSESSSEIQMASIHNLSDTEESIDVPGVFPIQKGVLAWFGRNAIQSDAVASFDFAPYKFVEIS